MLELACFIELVMQNAVRICTLKMRLRQAVLSVTARG